uniref:NADH-ubiquinone oxidoreductase chain 4 n=1 Tax=Paratenuisentis ambiguus TaxID=185730 RepID=K3W3Y4_PARAB|nr:NADH dehydrogenase subunit 4 [Paratenuisentis ambiguus]CCA94485.2 NADH dehydrogenase subunit 4 [Paratenuisentis ambiguus]
MLGSCFILSLVSDVSLGLSLLSVGVFSIVGFMGFDLSVEFEALVINPVSFMMWLVFMFSFSLVMFKVWEYICDLSFVSDFRIFGYFLQGLFLGDAIYWFSVIFFSVSSWVMLFIGFESVLWGLIMVILYSSGYQERLFSCKVLMLFTAIFSIPLLMMVMSLYNMGVYEEVWSMSGVNMGVVMLFIVSLAFMVKVPVYGFHQWLPIVHVEAPVSGSMVLAGVLIKTGVLGLILIVSSLAGLDSWLFGWFSLGVLVSLVKMLMSTDFKVVVAYSSIVHMGCLILGLFFSGVSVVMSSILILVFHSFVSVSLFWLVGYFSEFCFSRSFMVLKGVLIWGGFSMVVIFYLLVLNSGFPSGGGFWGELGVFYSILFSSELYLFSVFVLIFFSVVVNFEVIMVLSSSVSRKISIFSGSMIGLGVLLEILK